MHINHSVTDAFTAYRKVPVWGWLGQTESVAVWVHVPPAVQKGPPHTPSPAFAVL